MKRSKPYASGVSVVMLCNRGYQAGEPPAMETASGVSVVMLCNRSYQAGEPPAMETAIGAMAAWSGRTEMGALRSKEWACNASRIATTASAWHAAVLPTRRSTPPPPPPSPITTTTRSHSQCGLQQRRAVDGNHTPAMAMTLSCWVPT